MDKRIGDLKRHATRRVIVPHSYAEYLPTLALTLVTGEGASRRLLVGIRSSQHNVNHPDVVSVPTMRLPPRLGREIINGMRRGAPTVESILTPGVAHDPLGFSLWNLLSSKLSLGDAIEAKDFDLRIDKVAVVQGRSSLGVNDAGDERVELLTMINCQATLLKGGEKIPPSNPTFSHIAFVSYDDFVRVADTKSLGALGSEFEGFQTCIHGLCVESAVALHTGVPSRQLAVREPDQEMKRGTQWLATARPPVVSSGRRRTGSGIQRRRRSV